MFNFAMNKSSSQLSRPYVQTHHHEVKSESDPLDEKLFNHLDEFSLHDFTYTQESSVTAGAGKTAENGRQEEQS